MPRTAEGKPCVRNPRDCKTRSVAILNVMLQTSRWQRLSHKIITVGECLGTQMTSRNRDANRPGAERQSNERRMLEQRRS